MQSLSSLYSEGLDSKYFQLCVSVSIGATQFYCCSVKVAVLIIYVITALFSGASVIWLLVDRKIGYIIYFVLMFILSVFVLKTDILFEHKEKEKGHQ